MVKQLTTGRIFIWTAEFAFVFITWYVLWTILDHYVSLSTHKMEILVSIIAAIIFCYLIILTFPSILTFLQ
jgi:hypothetical protein